MFERPATTTPFATLLHFAKPSVAGQPRVLVVGPMSGHFTTLIRPTIRTLLADHDVYVIDWHNARDIPVEHGRFGLDEYIEHVMQALRHLGPDTHVVAVCQPAVPVLAAVALLAAADDPAQPASLTLMAGPVDTRVNPNRVNTAAETKPLSFFERRLISTVPARYAGAGRRVYPGVVQLTAFMSMNPKRHLTAHARLYRDLVAGNTVRAAATRAFYDEYGAVMDVPAEFYLETVGRIFQEHHLADRPVHLARRARRPGRHPAHRTAHGRGRPRRHLLPGADPGRARPVHRASRRSASSTTCSRASATTASSAARAGRRRSTPSSAPSSRASRPRRSPPPPTSCRPPRRPARPGTPGSVASRPAARTVDGAAMPPGRRRHPRGVVACTPVQPPSEATRRRSTTASPTCATR